MRLLLLRLEGPLQSWGDGAKWDERSTADMPTKSGIIGLIACCMGVERGDPRIHRLHRSLSVSVRTDNPGRLGVDFQTVSSEQMMNAEGKTKERTIISKRHYLQDASFLAAVSSDDDTLLDEIAFALLHPHWAPYLGRKSCVPTAPILAADTMEYASAEEALQRVPLSCRADKSGKIRITLEDAKGEHQYRDQLMDAAARRFTMRSVRYLTRTMEDNEDVSISADA